MAPARRKKSPYGFEACIGNMANLKGIWGAWLPGVLRDPLACADKRRRPMGAAVLRGAQVGTCGRDGAFFVNGDLLSTCTRFFDMFQLWAWRSTPSWEDGEVGGFGEVNNTLKISTLWTDQ